MHHPEDAHLEPLAAATLSRTKSLIDMKKTNIMLVEDNPDYRQAVSLALADEPWIENMRIFGAAEVALRALQTDPQAARSRHHPARHRPARPQRSGGYS